MSPDTIAHVTVNNRFPRVSGDEPVAATAITVMSEFSPRERG